MVKIGALGSGSAGNSLVLSTGDEAVIVDVGFSRRELRRRMARLALSPEKLTAVLLTHEHTDHSTGGRVFCNELNIPLCGSPRTIGFLERRRMLPAKVRIFEPGADFSAGEFTIEPFSVQHDAEEPVGFVIRARGLKIGVATDLGEVNQLACCRLRDCDALVLESNFDRDMLRDSPRDLMLKRRIAGRNGHLGNLEAVHALGELLTDRTKLLLLAHISRECNTPEIACSECHAELCRLGRESSLMMMAITQEQPLGCFELDDAGVHFIPPAD